MPMRAELHLILWVTALGLIAYPNIDTGGDAAVLSLEVVDKPIAKKESYRSPLLLEGSSVRDDVSMTVPIDSYGKTLFKALSLPPGPIEAETEIEPMQPAIEPQVVLKAIFEKDGIAWALVADSVTGAYQTVTIGDAFLNTKILEIGADSIVVQRGSDQSTQQLLLRGLGEAP